MATAALTLAPAAAARDLPGLTTPDEVARDLLVQADVVGDRRITRADAKRSPLARKLRKRADHRSQRTGRRNGRVTRAELLRFARRQAGADHRFSEAEVRSLYKRLGAVVREPAEQPEPTGTDPLWELPTRPTGDLGLLTHILARNYMGQADIDQSGTVDAGDGEDGAWLLRATGAATLTLDTLHAWVQTFDTAPANFYIDSAEQAAIDAVINAANPDPDLR